MDNECILIKDSAKFADLMNDVTSIMMDFVCYNQKVHSKSFQKFLDKGMHSSRASVVFIKIISRIQNHVNETGNGPFPIQHDLLNDVASILMDFVCYNQTPYSKTLQKFIATGAHDLRAGRVAIEILKTIDIAMANEKS